MLHLVTDNSNDVDKNQVDFRWKTSLDGLVSMGFLRSEGGVTSALGVEYSNRLVGAKNWRNFGGKDIEATKAPTGLAAVYFKIGYNFK